MGDAQWRTLATRLATSLTLPCAKQESAQTVGSTPIELACTASQCEDGWLVWLSTRATFEQAPCAPVHGDELADRLRLLQDFGRMALWERDVRTGAGRWDPQVYRLFGYSESDGTPQFEQAIDRLHPDDRERVRVFYREATRLAGRYETRFRIALPGRGISHVHTLCEVRNGADGQPERVIGVMIEDTDNVERWDGQQASKALLHHALDLSGVTVWRVDLQTRRIHFNGRGLGIVGLPSGQREVDLDTHRESIHADDRSSVINAAEEAMAGNDVVDVVARYRHVDGGYRSLLTRRVAQRDAAGSVIGLVGVALDVSELSAERERSREIATYLQMVAEAAGVGFWSWSERHTPMQWSGEMFRLYGRDPAIGAPSFDEGLRVYIHPDDRKRFERLSEHADADRGPDAHDEFRIIRGDGAVRWIERRSRAELRNGVTWQVGVHMDITARKQAEVELQAERERAQNATDAAGIGLWDRNLTGRVSFWNEQMYRLRGFDPADPRPVEELARLANHPEDQATLDVLARRHINDGVPYEHEMRVTWPDGSLHWLGTRGKVVRDADGRPIRLSGVNWDITHHKRIEQALRDKQAAEQASRAKSEFLARMSHELRTPLNAVLGFAQLMSADRQDPPTKHQRDRLAQMQTAGRHLLELINDVLDLAGVEGGTHVSLGERVSLKDSVREALQWVGALARERQVELSALEVSGVVLADRRRMRQILTNLLSNAVKYNRPGGSVEISTLRREREGQVEWGVRVRDSGIGMTSAQIEQLFQPFNRLGAESSTVEGTGIGLTIVRQIVHRMGGRIEVDSKPRQGSTFSVWLPAAPQIDAPDSVRGPLTAPGTDPGSADSVVEPLRVLCIEDNPVNLLLVEELFALRPRMQLATACSGTEGIAVALRQQPDLVLLDMQLPDMHGLEVLVRLRTESLLARTRFIALSANVMSDDIAQALAAGFEDYWTKPIDFARFLAGIDAIAAAR